MLMGVNIQYGRTDTPGVAEFFAALDTMQSHCLDYDPTPIENIATEKYYLALAVEDGVAVGCGVLNQDTGEIERLFVREDRRRQGVARAILAYLEQTAEIEGLLCTTLDVLNTNTVAISLYINVGYSLRRAEGNFLFFEKRLDEN